LTIGADGSLTLNPADVSTRNASIQVFNEGQDGSRVVRIIDVLPNEFSDLMARNMDKATEVMKRTLEGSARS
jgi:hypothetical protein